MIVILPGQDSALAQTLCESLTEVGFSCQSMDDPAAAVQACRCGHARLIACDDPQPLFEDAELPMDVGVVTFSGDSPCSSSLLQLMRAGVRDHWHLPIRGRELRQRVQALLASAQQVARQVEQQIEQRQIELQRDQRAGQMVQQRMLPDTPEIFGRIRLEHMLRPSLLLSGDWVDYFELDDGRVACYAADVAGHGASAAFVTVFLKECFRSRCAAAEAERAFPGPLLSAVNEDLIAQGLDKHIAMFVAVIDASREQIHYSAAAQFPPAVLVQDDEPVVLEMNAKPLGLFPGTCFETRTAAFPAGARLVVFTDGVLDLLPSTSVQEKEDILLSCIQQEPDLESLWARLVRDNVDADDVSCLMASHRQ